MRQQRVVYLEDDLASARLVEVTLQRGGVDADLTVAESKGAFEHVWASGPPDLILADHDVPGLSGLAALAEARSRLPGVPFVFVSASDEREQVVRCLEAGADDFIAKDQLWRLPTVVRRLLADRQRRRLEDDLDRQRAGLLRLVAAVKDLSSARSLAEIAAIVRSAARAINGADGATFILMEEDMCHYVDEDAIAPLWKGHRFPAAACIGGWVVQHKTAAVIEDIHADARVPTDAYQPTFVKSLVMVPVRRESPIAAIGNYWAKSHAASADEVALIQALADSTAVAMERVRVHDDLERRVQLRTAELEAANQDLDAFTASVSHDLRTPLATIIGFAELLREDLSESTLTKPVDRHLDSILRASRRMNGLLTDLLDLARLARADLRMQSVDITALAREIAAGLGVTDAGDARPIDWGIAESLVAHGDPNMLRVLLLNLLSNAAKYSGKIPHPAVEVGALHDNLPAGQSGFFVRDNGAGFDPQEAHRLFTPFGRLHSAHEFPGNGIGLVTCQRIIQRHQGRIWAESGAGTGATFYFSLPGPRAGKF